MYARDCGVFRAIGQTRAREHRNVALPNEEIELFVSNCQCG